MRRFLNPSMLYEKRTATVTCMSLGHVITVLTDRYRLSVKGYSLKPDLYQVCEDILWLSLYSPSLLSFRSSIELPLSLLITRYTYIYYR